MVEGRVLGGLWGMVMRVCVWMWLGRGVVRVIKSTFSFFNRMGVQIPNKRRREREICNLLIAAFEMESSHC